MKVDIDGPSAIGKTTLIRSLCQEFSEIRKVDELLMQKKNPYLSWKTKEEYLKKQLWFFDQTLQRYTNSPVVKKELQLNDIGITDVIVHTWGYPKVNLSDWNVWESFVQQIKVQYADVDLSDMIIYLYAPEEVIRMRQQEDTTRVRGAFQSNIRLYAEQKRCYEKLAETFPKQIFLVNAEGGPEQVKQEVLRMIKEYQEEKLQTHLQKQEVAGGSIRLYQLLDAIR